MRKEYFPLKTAFKYRKLNTDRSLDEKDFTFNTCNLYFINMQ